MKAVPIIHFSQFDSGTTRTVFCVERTGPEAIIVCSEFDPQNRLLREVRFEHSGGKLTQSIYTEFAADGRLTERWVLLHDARGRVTHTYGFDAEGNPLEPETHNLAS